MNIVQFVEGSIEPALWCDHGHWQVVRDETCLFLADYGPGGYLECRGWCAANGYGWLPVLGDGGPPAESAPKEEAGAVATDNKEEHDARTV